MKNMSKGSLIAIGVVVLFFVSLIVYRNNNNNYRPSELDNSVQETVDNKSNSNSKSLKAITDKKLKTNFEEACSNIKMDISKIKNLEKKDDWNSGPRYTFVYEGQTFILYALDNSDVSSITIANTFLDKIYWDGYEPVDVNDFLISTSTATSLDIDAENKIRDYLKYPSSAKFNWMEYGHARRYDIYQITGTFKAKNALGVEIDHVFTIQFKKDNNSFKVVYLNINNEKFVGSKSQLQEISRKELKKEEQKSDDAIILKEGVLGSYGKKDKFDGEDYIRYYIPAGTYKVEALTKNAMFYVETIKLHKEDGWDTATTIKTIKMNNVGDTDEFTIKKDQCITLVIYTQIKLTKIK